MEEMANLTNQMVNEMKQEDFENKKILVNYNVPLSIEQLLAVESIKKVKNPLVMIGIDYVMKDLKICKTVAYKIFARDDFPSINLGKSYKVMFLSYIFWKLNKRD